MGVFLVGVAYGAHQGLAVAAGDGAQGIALLEVVHEAHAASQHRAGAQEVGDHLLPADAAIPVPGRAVPELGSFATSPIHPSPGDQKGPKVPICEQGKRAAASSR